MSAPVYSIGMYDNAGTLIRTFGVPFSKFDATAAPTVSDDDTAGYVANSMWADRTHHKIYVCRDNATGAAVWSEIPGTAGGDMLAANNLSDLVSASTARTNLGLGSAATHPSTDFDASGAAAAAQAASQPLDADLTILAAITLAANTFLARSSSGGAAAKVITDFGLSLVDDVSASAAQTTLGATTLGGNLFTLTTTAGGYFLPQLNSDDTVTKINPTQLYDFLGLGSMPRAILNSGDPSAVVFLRANADNSVSWLAASAFRTAIGAGTGAGDALVANPLSQFAATTSAQLAGVISDETGSGKLVFDTSPTFVTPVLGVASATTLNKVTITAPATGSTLTIANGKTLTASNTLTLTGTDGNSVDLGTGGTVAYITNKLSVFAATSSSELAGVISDETGSGALVFAASPTLTNPVVGTQSAGDNSTKAASTAYVATAVASAITGLLNFKGATNCSSNPNYPSAVKGDSYIVSTAGKIGGASGTSVDIGDWYVCTADNTGGTEASVGTSWGHMEHNLVGALLASNNLSDLTSTSSARTNLGLGTLATQSGTFSGTSSGTNTGDQTNVSGSSGSCTGNAATVTTNANLTGPVTSVGNATSVTALAITNAMIAANTIDLTAKVTGLLPWANISLISSLTGVDPDLADIVPSSDASNSNANRQATWSYVGGLLNNGTCEGRLTLTSGTAITTSDVTGAGTLYFTPFNGNRVSLFDGTRWRLYTFSELSLSLSVTVANNYDIFLYDNAGTLTLESLLWTGNTLRATALVLQDGVYVKSGATTRRHIGTIRGTGTNTTESSAAKQFVWNRYNQVPRLLKIVDTNQFTYNTAAFQQWRASRADGGSTTGSGSNQVEIVTGDTTLIDLRANNVVANGVGGNNAYIGIGEDSTTASIENEPSINSTINIVSPHSVTAKKYPVVGYHYYSMLQFANGGGTTTWGPNATLKGDFLG